MADGVWYGLEDVSSFMLLAVGHMLLCFAPAISYTPLAIRSPPRLRLLERLRPMLANPALPA